MKLSIPPHIASIAPYVPGKPLEELARQYGVSDAVKLASNENPLGPSPKALEAIHNCLQGLNRYPDGAGHDLIEALAAEHGLLPSQIVIGNGSDDLLGMLARVFLDSDCQVVVPHPSFLMYSIVARSAGAMVVKVPLKDLAIDLDAMAQAVSERTRLVFLCCPNNPTGTVLDHDQVVAFLEGLPDGVIVVLDEAYVEFVRAKEGVQSLKLLEQGRPVVVLRTFSKAYGLAGLRVGYGLMPPEIAGMLNRVRMPFNVNSLAQAAALAALDDSGFLFETRSLVHRELDRMYSALDERGIEYYPSQANFFLIKVPLPADQVFEALLQEGVIVRSMKSYALDNYIRLSIGLPAENDRFLAALDRVLETLRP